MSTKKPKKNNSQNKPKNPGVDKQNKKNKNQKNMQAQQSNTKSVAQTLYKSQLKKLENKIAELEVAIESKDQEISDWKSKGVRLAADNQNLQKQSELDIADTKKRIKKQTVDSIFAFLNTLQLSFTYQPQTEDQKILSFIKTLEMSFSQVLNELKNQGVEVLLVKPGDAFNPEFMTILDGSPDNDAAVVKQVVSIGLKVDNQLIQPASVILT